MPPDKALLAQLPDPRRCKDKNPAAALDAVVKKYPWFRFGFRAGDRRISFDYAADPTGKRPGGNLLVSRIVVILPDLGERYPLSTGLAPLTPDWQDNPRAALTAGVRLLAEALRPVSSP